MRRLQFKDLSQAEFHSAMQALPLVSVDWVVVDVDGRVLTGWRENAPAHYVNLPHCLVRDAAESAALKLALPGKLQAVDGPQAAYLAQRHAHVAVVARAVSQAVAEPGR